MFLPHLDSRHDNAGTIMALVSPPSSPTIELRRCEALLVDDETFCNVPCRSPRGRFCNSHGREYVQLTQAYKSASKTVEDLKKQAWLSKKQVRDLRDPIEVAIAIGLAEEWREAIVEEIRGRQVQHRRFFVVGKCTDPSPRMPEVVTVSQGTRDTSSGLTTSLSARRRQKA